ncbi:MAG: hypothetical protein P4L36_22715 [Holophaga sp.]|nr:hypothetical protein [Holophaga sp.]
MERITTNPILIRFLLWLVAMILTVSVFLLWSGGVAQLLENVNDLF